MQNRTEKLRDVMAAHKLSADDVARLLNRTANTVRIWRCKDNRRIIPEHSLALLEARLRER